MSRVCIALADPGRRAVLGRLRRRPMTADELRAGLSAAESELSAECAMLRASGLVGAARQGAALVYWLCASVLEEALWALASVLKIGARRGGDGHSNATGSER